MKRFHARTLSDVKKLEGYLWFHSVVILVMRMNIKLTIVLKQIEIKI